MKKSIEVCFSPVLFKLYDSHESIVVVIDVLRATSSLCVAFENGVKKIIPVSTLEEAMTYRAKGYLLAAERNGEKIADADLGNSPFSYMDKKIKGATIVFTTTNGTRAINAAREAYQVVIGSFLNLEVLCLWLSKQQRNIIFLCAGWKNKFNLEDTLFAGAVTRYLIDTENFYTDCDSARAAAYLYGLAKNDLYKFLENSSHRKRLERLHIEKDIAYCLTPNQTNVVPVLKGECLIKIKS